MYNNLAFRPVSSSPRHVPTAAIWQASAAILCTYGHGALCRQGDNDPVDVVEIGSAAGRRGGVYKVKPLGVLAMIDDGELDWKVIAISVDDPKAGLVNDVEDVEK